MSPLDTLTEILNKRGLEVTPAEAEQIAARTAGSVEAYLEILAANEKSLEEVIEPPPGPVSDKWSEPLAYDVVPPEGSS